MKPSKVFAAGLLSLLGGCALLGGDVSGYSLRPQIVVVADGANLGKPIFFVSPGVLNFLPNQGKVEIVWSLPPATVLRFSEKDGIVIRGEILPEVVERGAEGSKEYDARTAVATTRLASQKEIVDCHVRAKGLEYSCVNLHMRPGRYKYNVQLTREGKSYVIDPEIANW